MCVNVIYVKQLPASLYFYFYLFGVLHRFQHCTGHITMGSWKDRGNQYIEFARASISIIM